MSTETVEAQDMGSKPVAEHAWLQQLVGEWKTEAEMMMPDGSVMKSEGTESVKDLCGLWAYGQGRAVMPAGEPMNYYTGLGYDLTFKEYRGFMIMDVSSHLWKYTGTLSEDGKTMTLDCVGPNMEKEGETANYRDVIHIIDENHRTMTSSGEQANGEWIQYMKVSYTRS